MKSGFHISTGFAKKCIVVMAVLAVIAVTLMAIRYYDIPKTIENAGSSPTADANENKEIEDSSGNFYRVDANVESILLLGIDKYSKDAQTGLTANNQQADVLLLCVLDHTEKEYTLVQINRDTVTKFDALGATGGTYEVESQIALSHAYGTGGSDSCYNTLRAVEYLFYGINIEHYASIKLDAISIMNDAVGGVEVELLDDFTMVHADMKKGETYKLMGEQATRYIRERGLLEDSSNTSRMERQRQYMSAWQDRFFESREKDENITYNLFSDISNYMVSNIDIYELERFVECIDSYRSNGIVVPEGTTSEVTLGGETHVQFKMDDVALRQLVIDLFCVSDSESAETEAVTAATEGSETGENSATSTTEEVVAQTTVAE